MELLAKSLAVRQWRSSITFLRETLIDIRYVKISVSPDGLRCTDESDRSNVLDLLYQFGS